ncbi:DUF4873 domain-containing protein [Nocardia sp. NPDC004068]|uniref:DUF4873 domain-containing protein n=1 Tax=Nocardia sp. NPDC004068 TaxID=3364303 RepID=UPI0036B67C67
MAFLGIALHGFPNLFFTEPPGASDFRPPITERAEAVRACAEMLRHTASTRIEARAACQHEYARLVRGGRHRPPRQARPHHFDLTVPADREAPHEYSGPALLDVPGGEIPVTVTLNGHADPIDGRYHWYGRVDGNGDLPDPGRAQVFLTVPGGTPTEGRLQERDPWGQLRIVGVGEPPFPMAAHGH